MSIPERDAQVAMKLAAIIRPLLAGQGPLVQGGVLADLVSIWIAGCGPSFRDEMLEGWIALVKSLIPVQEQALFGPNGDLFREKLQ